MGCISSKPSNSVTTPRAVPSAGATSPASTQDDKSKKPEVTRPASGRASSALGGRKLPPLVPPRRTKEQLMPDPGVFSEVDEYVKQISKTPANSVEQLAKTLTTKYNDELRKLRALFCWMAFNIRYDTESYFSGEMTRQNADSVLTSGRAVCQGYSELFDALCRVADIPCLLVSGIAKGYSHDPENVYTAATKTNHAWNLVLVQGEWRPLDSTWGAGHVDYSRHFVRQFEDSWFLTDPQQFVLKHFPLMNSDLKESEKYQLLKRPMTIDQFSAHVKPENAALTLGLTCLTHEQTVIDVIHDVTIKVKAERQSLESMNVTMEERGSSTVVSSSTDVLASLDDAGTCTIYVRPSRVATYLLKVMGRGKDQDPSKVHLLVTYVIRCKETAVHLDPFPDKDGAWGLQNPTATECEIRLTAKQHSIANTRSDTPFLFTAKNSVVTVPVYFTHYVTLKTKLVHAGAEDDLQQFTIIEHTDGGALISARLAERGYYLLRLFSSHPAKELLHPVADLLLFCDGKFSCQPYPQVFSTANQQRAKLLTPLVGVVPRGQPTLYRVSAPSLGKLTVAGQKMDRKNDGVWEAEVTPPDGKSDVTIFGAEDQNAKSLSGLFKFSIKD